MTPHCHWTVSPPRVSSVVAPAAHRFDGTPAAPASLPAERRWTATRPRPGGGSGDATRSARGCLSADGLGAEAPSQVLPTPAGPPPRTRRDRLTTRPARAPRLTGLSLGGDEPAAFRMATEPGTPEYRDRPGRCPRHSRLAPWSGAAGVRMSVGCGSSGPLGAGRRACRRSEVGSPDRCPRHRCCDPEKRRQEKRPSPWPWKLFSLDFENLMRVRRRTHPHRSEGTARPGQAYQPVRQYWFCRRSLKHLNEIAVVGTEQVERHKRGRLVARIEP